MENILNEILIPLSYLLASILFIFGLKQLAHPQTARRGMNLAGAGMLVAIIGTLFHHDIISYDLIILGLILGSLIGAAMSIWMPMTAMPQRTALSHAFGALAASLVGVAEYWHALHSGHPIEAYKMTALGFEVLFGSLTVTGSLLAFAKLQELMRGTPVTYKGQNILNVSLFALAAFIFVYLIFDPTQTTLFFVMVGLSFLFGILLVLPIGAAD
ncbi:MAG: NAD(P)(+) transhydrogenase (Re/Si-specific) subunit beta, partial [Acidobacteriota bacterium]